MHDCFVSLWTSRSAELARSVFSGLWLARLLGSVGFQCYAFGVLHCEGHAYQEALVLRVLFCGVRVAS
jgi:hypothetical protein